MHVVSFDFQSDVTSCGRRVTFDVIDEYTRTASAIVPLRSFTAMDVVAVLDDIIADTGIPPDLRPLGQRTRTAGWRTNHYVDVG